VYVYVSMSQTVDSKPNGKVRAVYDELSELLEQGDDVFVEEGPDLLKEAISESGFFKGVSSEYAEQGEYTRKKVIGDPGEHVIRYMEWPPEFPLLPHEHHGRPCFEVLVEGHLALSELERTQVGENEYTFDVIDTTITRPGESAVVDPRENEIHAVYSPVRSRSLHVYPDDNWKAYGYVLKKDTGESGTDIYERKEFQLREEP